MKASLLFLTSWLLCQALPLDLVPSFLQMTDADDVFPWGEIASQQNPMNRDIDDLPEDADDKGDEAIDGDTYWLLVSSFDVNTLGSGQVWAVPRAQSRRDDAFVLIGGLQTPTGVCFDKNHDFLYVCDSAQRRVYQFEIDRDGKRQFILASDQVATVYEGLAPVDCSIDAYGNIYIADMITQTIEFIDYLSLWSGLVGNSVTLYSGSEKLTAVIGIEVEDSDTVYFANSANPQDSGVLNSAPAFTLGNNTDSITTRLRTNLQAQGLGLSEDYVYISGADGSVWAFDYHGDPNLYLKSAGYFVSPRGICTGDGRVYVADISLGGVYRLEDSNDEDDEVKRVIGLAGAFGLACVND